MATDSLTMRVTNYIFDYVRKNQLSYGDSLPSELRTSTDLKISRGIVREAFRSLEVAGIIEKSNGRSPKVGVMDRSFLTHLMVHALSTRQISVKQVLEVRASVEGMAAELAARRIVRSEIQTLQRAIVGMKKSLDRPEVFARHDLAFHSVINGASGNPLIQIFSGAMHECMQDSMRLGMLRRTGRAEKMKVIELHKAIVAALEKGSAVQARATMKKHFSDTNRTFAKLAE